MADTKKMKSFRLYDDTAQYLADTAHELGISQSELIELALVAFDRYGMADGIAYAIDRGVPKRDLPALVNSSGYGGHVSEAIYEQTKTCADDWR